MIRILIMRILVAAYEEPKRPVGRRERFGQAAARTQAQRGLTEAVLQGIRTDVFNVAAPIGP